VISESGLQVAWCLVVCFLIAEYLRAARKNLIFLHKVFVFYDLQYHRLSTQLLSEVVMEL
jgi:hypothetical protein